MAAIHRVPQAFGSDGGAEEEVVVVQPAVGGDGAMLAVGHVEDVDAVVLFWFVAADEEGVDVVAHCGVRDRYWGRGGGGG